VWTALISLPLASAVQETAARLGLMSGRGLMSLIKEGFARPVLWLAAVLGVGANLFNIGADLGSMAEAFRLLIPVPFAVLVVAMAGTILLLEIFVSYDRCSLILRWLALSIFARARRSRNARPGGSDGSMPRRSARCASTSCRVCRQACS
jgi:Mn2+/Fe2+ NRAMP family transporter